MDQIVIMTYDSLMPHAVLYRAWMREQVEGISERVEDTDVELLIGVSASAKRLPHTIQVQRIWQVGWPESVLP